MSEACYSPFSHFRPGTLLAACEHVHDASGVGAGDAMVAAIAVGLSRGWPLPKSVCFGVAAGAAMLMTPGTACCNRADVERLFELVAEPADLGAVCS
jgi:6-phosphofructokinase 2